MKKEKILLENLYERLVQHLVEKMFHSQKRNSIKRGHELPCYTKNDLFRWVKTQSNFKILFDTWILSNFDKNLTPSCDRKDVEESYIFSNLQLCTWRENLLNEVKRKSEPINAYNLQGSLIKEFISITQAAKYFNLDIRTCSIIANNRKLYDEKNNVILLKAIEANDLEIDNRIQKVFNFLGRQNELKVWQYDLNGGFIKIHANVTEASFSTGASRSRILESIKTKSSTSANSIWIRCADAQKRNEILEEVLYNLSVKDPRQKPIVKCNMKGKIIKRYNSISEVTLDNYSKGTISSVLNGKRKKAYNSLWLYSKDATINNIQRLLKANNIKNENGGSIN